MTESCDDFTDLNTLNVDPLKIMKIQGPDFYIYGPHLALPAFPGLDYKSFPDNYCGAGNGLGEKLVPDWIGRIIGFWKWAVKISPACWAHDHEWDLAPPTWDAFYASNGRFQQNINRMIRQKGRWGWLRTILNYRATTYMNAVATAGQGIFWKLKKRQGHVIPASAEKFV